MKVWIIIFIFFMLNALLIISNGNLSMVEAENFDIFLKSYVGWFDQIFQNIQVITGNVVDMKWVG